MQIRSIVLGACVLAASTPARAGTGVADCVGVATSNGSDDTAAIRAAIATAMTSTGKHVVCLGGGTFTIAATGRVGTASLDLGGLADLAIVGAGPGTVLRMTGDPGGTGWWLFKLSNGATRIVLRDLVLDGSGITGTVSANTKLMQIGTGDALGVSDVTVDHVTLRGSPKDAVEILGSSSATNVSQIAIRSSRISGNALRGIDILQGTKTIQISSSFFDGNSGEDIKAFYSGTLTIPTPVDGLSLVGNTIFRTTSNAVGVYLYGNDTATHKHVVIGGNVLAGCRVFVKNVDQLTIANNLIYGGTQATADPELYVVRLADLISITGNLLVRGSVSTAGVLVMTHVSGATPRSPGPAIVAGNVFLQPTPTTVVDLSSVKTLMFDANYLGYTGTTANPGYGLALHATINAIDGVVIANNQISTEAGTGIAGGIAFQPTNPIGGIAITHNNIENATVGVTFLPGAGYSTIPMVVDNQFTGTDISGLSTALAVVAIGGNVGSTTSGPVQLTGVGAPTVAAPVGSIYLRRDAGSNALYVCEAANTWRPK
jgi:hypothetical protein